MRPSTLGIWTCGWQREAAKKNVGRWTAAKQRNQLLLKQNQENGNLVILESLGGSLMLKPPSMLQLQQILGVMRCQDFYHVEYKGHDFVGFYLEGFIFTSGISETHTYEGQCTHQHFCSWAMGPWTVVCYHWPTWNLDSRYEQFIFLWSKSL